MDSLGNILYLCTLLHIICEHLHNLYTMNSLSGWKGLKNFIPRDSFNSSLYILFSMYRILRHLSNIEIQDDVWFVYWLPVYLTWLVEYSICKQNPLPTPPATLPREWEWVVKWVGEGGLRYLVQWGEGSCWSRACSKSIENSGQFL